jgi:hypothetical protein
VDDQDRKSPPRWVIILIWAIFMALIFAACDAPKLTQPQVCPLLGESLWQVITVDSIVGDQMHITVREVCASSEEDAREKTGVEG